MFNLAFSRAALRTATVSAVRPAAVSATASSRYAGVKVAHFSSSRRVAEEDADPTPDKGRGGSEQSMPGASGADIADSDGAYDSQTTRPDQSGKQMEKENSDINMEKSAASEEPAKNATDGKSEKTSSGSGSKPGASGGSAVRGGNAN